MISFIQLLDIEEKEDEDDERDEDNPMEINMAYSVFYARYYYGQLNESTQQANGIGLAINSEGEILEGMFKNGSLAIPYLHIKHNGEYTLVLETDQVIYEIYFEDFTFLKAKKY